MPSPVFAIFRPISAVNQSEYAAEHIHGKRDPENHSPRRFLASAIIVCGDTDTDRHTDFTDQIQHRAHLPENRAEQENKRRDHQREITEPFQNPVFRHRARRSLSRRSGRRCLFCCHK